jgi:hypothetical protein
MKNGTTAKDSALLFSLRVVVLKIFPASKGLYSCKIFQTILDMLLDLNHINPVERKLGAILLDFVDKANCTIVYEDIGKKMIIISIYLLHFLLNI